MNKTQIEKCIKLIDGFPPLPFSLNKLLNVIEQESTGATDIAHIIGMDQALTANVLKLVNSAYYGYASRISNISHAVVLLGFDTIKNLSLGLAVMNIISETAKADAGKIFYWEHAIGTAIASRIIMKRVNKSLAEETFTGGLLHDIGKIIFLLSLEEDYIYMYQEALEESFDVSAVEQEKIGIDHARLGASLARKWNFPIELQYILRFHHTPENLKQYSPNTIILNSCAIYLGNWISKLHVFGLEPADCTSQKFHQIKKILDIPDRMIINLHDSLDDHIGELRRFFDM